MLHVENIRAGYGRTEVLHGVSLDLPQGDMVAVLGRNGVGKTSLLKAIIGEIPLTSGSVKLAERDFSKSGAHMRARGGIAYVPQGREIFPQLSVLDNLRVAAYATRKKDWTETLETVMDEFPVLREKSGQAGGSLSGGQQQILALGRALMTTPRVLLLDEPSEGIQPSIVDQIAQTIGRINRERGITVIVVEQNLDFASKIADQAYLMDKGEIVRSLSTDDVVNDRDLQHEFLGV